MIDPVDVAIGARLRAKRTELGLTQRDVAHALTITHQQVRKYECGANRLSPLRILALSTFLKVQPSYFFHVEISPNVKILSEMDVLSAIGQDDDWLRLNRSFPKISSIRQRRLVLALVKELADQSIEGDDLERALTYPSLHAEGAASYRFPRVAPEADVAGEYGPQRP